VNQPTLESMTKTGRRSGAAFCAAIALLLALGLVGPAIASDVPTPDEPEAAAAVAEDSDEAEDTAEPGEGEPEPVDLAGQWGIEVTSIRLTAHNHMIDFRYRVLDPVKAKELFVRQNKPALIHQETGKVLAVPETAKVGPLRNSNDPQQGKIYWMFFGNAGDLVKANDRVTVVIGDFRAEDLVVE